MIEDDAITVTLRVRRSTLELARELVDGPVGTYPSPEDASDFMELNWDLMEELAALAHVSEMTEEERRDEDDRGEER